MERAVEELDRSRKHSVTQRQPVTSEPEKEDEVVVPFRAPVPSPSALEVIRKKHGPSLTVQWRNLPISGVREASGMMMKLKGRQKRKWRFDRALKAAKAVPAQKQAL